MRAGRPVQAVANIAVRAPQANRAPQVESRLALRAPEVESRVALRAPEVESRVALRAPRLKSRGSNISRQRPSKPAQGRALEDRNGRSNDREPAPWGGL